MMAGRETTTAMRGNSQKLLSYDMKCNDLSPIFTILRLFPVYSEKKRGHSPHLTSPPDAIPAPQFIRTIAYHSTMMMMISLVGSFTYFFFSIEARKDRNDERSRFHCHAMPHRTRTFERERKKKEVLSLLVLNK